MRDSEERYRSIFEDTRDAIFIINKTGKIIVANQSTIKLFGYTKAVMSEMNIQKLFVKPAGWKRIIWAVWIKLSKVIWFLIKFFLQGLEKKYIFHYIPTEKYQKNND